MFLEALIHLNDVCFSQLLKEHRLEKLMKVRLEARHLHRASDYIRSVSLARSPCFSVSYAAPLSHSTRTVQSHCLLTSDRRIILKIVSDKSYRDR